MKVFFSFVKLLWSFIDRGGCFDQKVPHPRKLFEESSLMDF
jgi:hypothetical protein